MAEKDIIMQRKNADGTFDQYYPKTKADNVSLEDAGGNFAASNVEGALIELFTSVSSGKAQLETAVTDMGGEVSKAGVVATFGELDAGIRGIPTGPSTYIRSAQRGVSSMPAGSTSRNISITPVNPDNSIVFVDFERKSYGNIGVSGTLAVGGATLTLAAAEHESTRQVTWQVIEFEPGVLKSLQRGSVTALSEVTVTITAVSLGKSISLCNYHTTAANTLSESRVWLTSPTGLYIPGGYRKVNWWVLEFN